MLDYLLIIGLAFAVLAIIWGACVFGRRIVGRVWGIMGNLLHKRR